MPGDGIGVDVMDAARLVLDRLGLDAEYVPAEIGWDLWRQEGDAVSARVITRRGASRIARSAFEYAKTHGYPNVTLVEKPNVLRETSGLMVEAAREVAREYPGLPLWETNIDAQVMWLLKNPRDYGVLVTSN